ncbi:MAG: GNAT family N-acetyltransferase [Elusimicrobiales bacterium]|nr:GNAT family N-acetyltransferase [Elusimicrobiales bacterium]
MGTDFEIIPFDPHTATDELWTLYFDQTEAAYREYEPEDPLLSRAKKKELTLSSLPNPYRNDYTYLVLAEGGAVPAASASMVVEAPGSPTYASNKHIGNLHGLSVSPKYRRQGLATRLVAHILRDMAIREPQVTELQVPAALETGHKFLERKGGTVSLVHSENRLYLKDADWAMIERWDAEGARRNPGTEILTVTEIPETDLQDYARAYTETINQQPLGGLQMKMEITPDQIRYMEKKSAEQGTVHTTIYTREADGRVGGLTETSYLGDLGHVARQMLTGVRQEYRGRGLGKLLKARMLLHIRREYPGVKYIVTGNADSNAPMMAINTALGFKKHLPVLLYTLKIKPELLK